MTPHDPDPDPEDPPRPLLSPGFWAALALGLALMLAGAAFGLFGAELFPRTPPHAAPHGR